MPSASRFVSALTVSLLVTVTGCPPEELEPAPEDIDDPIRAFWTHFGDEQPDVLNQAVDTFVAHLLDCEASGAETPECDLENGLSTTMLTDEDVAEVVEDGRMEEYPTAEEWDTAVSVVVGRRMPISVDIIEDVLIGPDQQEIFPHFEQYERTYLTSRSDYEDGTDEFLRTVNDVTSSYIITTASYTLWLDMRQWTWAYGETDRRVVCIRSWLHEDATFPSEGMTMAFTFSMEVLIPYVGDDEQTWRTMALWAHADIEDTEEKPGFWEEQLAEGTIDGFDEMQDWVDDNY